MRVSEAFANTEQERIEAFKRSDLYFAIEALQVTYNNIVADNPDAADNVVNDMVHDHLWDAGINRKSTQIGYVLGVTAFWASLNGVDTPSLELRLKEVRDNAHR